MRRWPATFVVLLAAIVAGCGSPQRKQSLERENSHLRWLLRLHLDAGQKGRQTHSAAEFKQYLDRLDQAMRERVMAGAKVRSLDELFTSERDGLPYVFVVQPTPGVATGLFAYEQQGVGGTRYVGYTLGFVEEVDENRFNELVPSARAQ